MNGAHALIRTLVDSDVDVCFTNPGTSEMHFVAALDDVDEMRGILCLFEGVASAAADGYARMADRPAATLLHLGPGLGNAFANLHNARRANTPMVNIVGDHATYHKQYDAPLESDIDALAGACSGFVRRSTEAATVATDAAETAAAARSGRGQVATLILPADTCWLEAPGAVAPVAPTLRRSPSEAEVQALADQLGEQTVLIVGGSLMREEGLVASVRVAAASGARLYAETFPARHERGAGLPVIERLAYLAEFAQMQIGDPERVVVIDAAAPVSFFAYPDKPSVLTPESAELIEIDPDIDPVALLAGVADHLGAPAEVDRASETRPDRPSGPLTSESVAAALGALMPEGCIVADEANTSGLFAPGATAGAPRHDWLCLTGGAIGIGMPLATGAAVACPDRTVICLEADGSAMYTLQALWTQVRENLKVVTIVYANRSYAVLNMELARVGAETVGPKALSMLDLTNPELDMVSLARGMGVSATRADTSEQFVDQLRAALAADGPSLIEAVVPPLGL